MLGVRTRRTKSTMLAAALIGGVIASTGPAGARESDQPAGDSPASSVPATGGEPGRLAREFQSRTPEEILERFKNASRKAVIGLKIGKRGDRADGVAIKSVMPQGPAESAGLRAGDVILAVDGQSLAPTSSKTPTEQLVERVAAARPGDVLRIDFRRDGERGSLDLVAGGAEPAWEQLVRDNLEVVQDALQSGDWGRLLSSGSAPGALELTALTPELGRYFGTERGMLVLRVPDEGALDLQAGDVILEIGGRRPDSPEHAASLLRAYQPGDRFEMLIVRDGEQIKLQLEMPESPAGS